MAETQRYKLTIAYRGTCYHGWQAQPLMETYSGPAPEPGTGIPTIQETVARTLSEVIGHPISLTGSSRTDAGVHAKGQIAHFDTDKTQIPPENIRRATNHRLPDDILIRKIEPVQADFDVMRWTLSKRYQYCVWNHPDRPIFFSDLAWHRWQPLDVPRMRAAAQHFVGEHDFASFVRPGHGRASTVRTVYSADVSQYGPRIVIGIEGRGFLWNQVRIMVGTLMHVGLRRHESDVIVSMLAAKDREAGGPTAPAHGLYLQWIKTRTDPPPPRPPREPVTTDVAPALVEESEIPLVLSSETADATKRICEINADGGENDMGTPSPGTPGEGRGGGPSVDRE